MLQNLPFYRYGDIALIYRINWCRTGHRTGQSLHVHKFESGFSTGFRSGSGARGCASVHVAGRRAHTPGTSPASRGGLRHSPMGRGLLLCGGTLELETVAPTRTRPYRSCDGRRLRGLGEGRTADGAASREYDGPRSRAMRVLARYSNWPPPFPLQRCRSIPNRPVGLPG